MFHTKVIEHKFFYVYQFKKINFVKNYEIYKPWKLNLTTRALIRGGGGVVTEYDIKRSFLGPLNKRERHAAYTRHYDK